MAFSFFSKNVPESYTEHVNVNSETNKKNILTNL